MLAKFSKVKNGQRFFDPYSGDFYVKKSTTYAESDSGGDGVGDEFGEDELVEISVDDE
jgi:hypothetical protein